MLGTALASSAPGLANEPVADFVLVDRDPLLAAPGDIRTAQIMQVWIGGVKVRGE